MLINGHHFVFLLIGLHTITFHHRALTHFSPGYAPAKVYNGDVTVLERNWKCSLTDYSSGAIR